MTSYSVILFTLFICLTDASRDNFRQDIRSRQNGPRIIGGSEVSITDIPYQASFQYANKHICGGSIISKYHILTAAHCTINIKPQYVKIRVGSSLHDSGGVLVDIYSLTIHPLYRTSGVDYDICIVTLKEPLRFNNATQPIRLASPYNYFPVGTPAVVSGWGAKREPRNDEEVMKSHYLRSAVLAIQDIAACKATYGVHIMTNNMLCIGISDGSRDSCQGDSGGPLVANGVQIGVVSFGMGCGRPRIPGVYMNVAVFRRFIDEVMSTGVEQELQFQKQPMSLEMFCRAVMGL